MSMTDFVLEQNKNLQWTDNDILHTIVNYAQFLKQPLELWMFVPCDENGNVLEDPQIFIDLRIEKYQQAKERCLFEGFEFEKKADWYILKFKGSTAWVSWNESKTIEDIIYLNLELTPTAIKQLGL